MYFKVYLLIVIIKLLVSVKSVYFCPKVITLSGFHCNYKWQMAALNSLFKI
jgi:hypothetical protein